VRANPERLRVTTIFKNLLGPKSNKQNPLPVCRHFQPTPARSPGHYSLVKKEPRQYQAPFDKEQGAHMSQRQVDANRINGAKGGVKTWEGKQISKMNAERHGFTSKKLVLTTEEEPHFNALLEGYLEELNPQGLEETDLVREVVAGKWRQERYWELETAVMELSLVETNADITNRFEEIDPLAKTAYSLVKQYGHLKALDMVTRVEGRMRRLHQTARRDLARIQAARTPKDAKPAPIPPKPVEPEPIQDEPISFRSFVSKEELARIRQNRNEPKFLLDLPDEMPEEDPNGE
jgi:hypothetical protein